MKFPSTPSILILAAAFGAGAGIIATSITLNSLRDYSAAISSTGSISLSTERPRSEPESFEQAVQEIREKVVPSTVELFSAPTDSTGAYEPGEGSGSGFFITSDGWILVAPNNLSTLEISRSIILFGQKIYPVQEVASDAFSPVVFIKIEISNAPVTSFGNALAVEPGDNLFVAGAFGSILPTSLFRFVQIGSISAPADVVNRRLELGQSLDKSFGGAAVSNSSGEVVGILIADGSAITSTVLPITAVRPIIHSLLKDGTASGLLFGAVATDLSRAIGYDEIFTRDYTRGALLGTISKGSPAEAAGLQKGDIVISVGGLEINERQSLAELLSYYRVGNTVNLVVDSEGVILKVDLVLGSR